MFGTEISKQPLFKVGLVRGKEQYCLFVKAPDQTQPLYSYTGYNTLTGIAKFLQWSIYYETVHYPPHIAELFKKITALITDFPDKNIMTPCINALKTLRKYKVSQAQAEMHLAVFGQQYIDDSQRWDLIADLPDCITGWCAPELHIWHSCI